MGIVILFWLVFGALVGWITALASDISNPHTTVAYTLTGAISALFAGLLLYIFDHNVLAEFSPLSIVFTTVIAFAGVVIISQTRHKSQD